MNEGCTKCQIARLQLGCYSKVEPLPYTIIISRHPLERLVIDTTCLPVSIRALSKPYTALLTVVDQLSKFGWGFPIKGKKAAEVKPLIESILMSLPEGYKVYILQSDRGKEFLNRLVKDLCVLWRLDHKKSAPYHPQTNG